MFGSACYPWLRPYSNNKLELRSRQCAFVGYSLTHKGYKCLDPTSSRIFLSRHITFDESSFPFQSNSTTTSPSSVSLLKSDDVFWAFHFLNGLNQGPLCLLPFSGHIYLTHLSPHSLRLRCSLHLHRFLRVTLSQPFFLLSAFLLETHN